MSAFADRWVLVSGASSGIGRAIAVELSSRGARLVLIGRRRPQLEDTAARCGTSEICELDLSKHELILPAVSALSAKLGRFYGLVHAAGVSQVLPLSASKPDRLRAMFDLNFVAGAELARGLTKREVLDEAGGSILWIGSVAAHIGAPGQVGYCASKGAVTAAVRAMALELAPKKTRVNVLSPGVVATEMTEAQGQRLSPEQWQRIVERHPLGTGTPGDVARAAAFLLDPSNSWITGADLAVDGGYMLQ